MNDSFFKKVLFVRRVEEFVAQKAKNNEINLPIHLSIGQEIISVALCEGLKKTDYIWGTYRSHAIFINRTRDLVAFFSELLGKVDGCNHGKGGSMHLHSKRYKILGASGIVGSNIPNAVGFAYGLKIKRNKSIVCVVFGDGATDAGTFYDSINIALLKQIPMIFLMEDNNLAIRTTLKKRQFNTNICKKIESFGIKVLNIKKNPTETFKAIKDARNYVLKNNLPIFIRVKTIRWYQHLGFEYELNKKYRDYKSEANILAKDEINIWLKKIELKKKIFIEKKIFKEIEKSWKTSLESKYPDKSYLFSNIF